MMRENCFDGVVEEGEFGVGNEDKGTILIDKYSSFRGNQSFGNVVVVYEHGKKSILN
jgi:hypothetical protein